MNGKEKDKTTIDLVLEHGEGIIYEESKKEENMSEEEEEGSAYTHLTHLGGGFIMPQKKDRKQDNTLAPGIYELKFHQGEGEVIFQKSKSTHDKLLRLPGTEFDQVMSEIDSFLQPETKKVFKDMGYVYKNSFFLHGVPGTGKTSIVNRVAEEVVEKGGVVILNPDPQLLVMAFKVLDALQPNALVMVAFEEFDHIVQVQEDMLTNILDGEVQKDNVIYVATTNYIERIPDKVLRPGRFSTVLEVGFPGEEAREAYLKEKIGDTEEASRWAKKTNNLSIDELRETVRSVKCLGHDLDSVVNRVLKTKGMIEDRQQAREKAQNEGPQAIVLGIQKAFEQGMQGNTDIDMPDTGSSKH